MGGLMLRKTSTLGSAKRKRRTPPAFSASGKRKRIECGMRNRRRNKLGTANRKSGRYAKATLAVLFPRHEQVTELRRWERLLGVEILIGDEALKRFRNEPAIATT